MKTDLDGTYSIKLGNKFVKTINLTANKAETITLTDLNAGEYSVGISNDETGNYEASSASAQFKVGKYTPTVNVKVENVAYPNDVVVNVASDVSGICIVKIGDETQSVQITANKSQSVKFKNLNANEKGYALTVTFNETPNHNAVSKTASVKVYKASSKVTIDPISDTDYGKDITITFSIENKTQATYTITKEGQQIKTGNINDNKIVLSNLDAGKYAIRIVNPENENYKSSENSADFKIIKINTTPDDDIIENIESTYGEPITIPISNDNVDV